MDRHSSNGRPRLPQVILRVVKLSLTGDGLDPGTVRVDRRTDWGNPFVMRDENERNQVCDLFEQYAQWRLSQQPDWLKPLRGKHLACWCAPKRCHAETLMRLANK